MTASDLPVTVRCFLERQFLKQDPIYEYRLLVAPFLRRLEYDHNLEKFREFLKSQGVILRAELDDRTFTKQGRIGKDDVMLCSREGKRFFWCNGKTSCIELRSADTPENILRVFPIKLEENYKFIDLTRFGDTHLVVEIGKKAEKKNSYKEGKIRILDIETGDVKSLEDKDFPYVDDVYPYEKTPHTLFISFSRPQVIVNSQTQNSSLNRWVIFDLKQGTQLVVGEFLKDPGYVLFDKNDRPVFSVFHHVHGEQSISRITEGPKWTVTPIFSFGKDMYDQRRLHNVTENGNIYFSARGKDLDLDRWTPIKRTQKGAFSSEVPLLPDETGDIKHLGVHTHTDGENVIVYEVREGGRKTLKCQTNSNAYKYVQKALETLQKKYSGEFSFVSLQKVLPDHEKRGMILSRRQSHRPLEYFILSFSQESKTPKVSIFSPKTSLNFPLERFREVESVMIPTREGFEMPAFIMPANLKVLFGKKPPLFVHIHGGPHAKDKPYELDALSQLVSSSGYFVLKINYPGSTGSGLAYEKRSDGKWDETPEFIMQAIDWMIKEKGVDPDRVAVGGVSFGAAMAVNMAARFPEHIKFAVACNGAYNYPKTALEAIGYDDDSGKHIKSIHDGETAILQLGGDPRIPEQKELLYKKSIYPHLSKIKGPILLLAGLEDNNCIPSQSIELAKALSRAQKSVRLITFEGRGHSLENVNPQKGESLEAYSFSAWNAVGAFTMKEMSRLFGTPYEPIESDFSEKMPEWRIKIALSHHWQ